MPERSIPEDIIRAAVSADRKARNLDVPTPAEQEEHKDALDFAGCLADALEGVPDEIFRCHSKGDYGQMLLALALDLKENRRRTTDAEHPTNPEEQPSGLTRLQEAIGAARRADAAYGNTQRLTFSLDQAAKLETMLRFIEDNPTNPHARALTDALKNLSADLTADELHDDQIATLNELYKQFLK